MNAGIYKRKQYNSALHCWGCVASASVEYIEVISYRYKNKLVVIVPAGVISFHQWNFQSILKLMRINE